MARPWADQPYRLLDIPGQPGAVTTENKYILDVAIEMANVHNLILRGMNAIYLQCEHVHDSADIKDFVQFIEFWGDTVHHHHHQEETLAFPEWNKIAKEGGATTDLMSENIEQHHAFEGGFQALLDYVKEVQDGKATYDGRKVTATLDSFCPVLNQHLHDEIKTIMGLEKYDGKKVKAVFAKVAEAAIKTADPVSHDGSAFLRQQLTLHRTR